MDDNRKKLKQKIYEKKIQRSSAEVKEQFFESSLKSNGIDPEEYKKNLNLINKLSSNQRNQLFKSLLEKSSS